LTGKKSKDKEIVYSFVQTYTYTYLVTSKVSTMPRNNTVHIRVAGVYWESLVQLEEKVTQGWKWDESSWEKCTLPLSAWATTLKQNTQKILHRKRGGA